jgi:hypothetical protein
MAVSTAGPPDLFMASLAAPDGRRRRGPAIDSEAVRL